MVSYLLPVLTAAMLGYMVWAVAVRLRRDRVKTERERSRGRFAFRRPIERVRFLLNRTFRTPDEEPEWEKPLVSSLSDVRVEPSETRAADEARKPREETTPA
ncbi:MAG: hypothetical protein ACK40O_03910 [Allosphingosinicella sp.]